MGDVQDLDYAKLDIEHCFVDPYVVPAYQREYVWEAKQVEQLLTDVMSAYSTNPSKPYFMGMTVVYKNGSCWELIDGQQRITTFFVFLCAIIRLNETFGLQADSIKGSLKNVIRDDEGNEVDKYRLELQYAESEGCIANIYNGKIPAEEERLKESQSNRRIYDAYIAILKELKSSFTEKKEVAKFTTFFLRNIRFVQIESKDISDALRIFETINQRGVGLNSMDLLKNMIFMQIKRDEFSQLNDKWKAIMDRLADVSEKPLRFLRYYITATYDISDSTGVIKGILPEDDIYSWFTENNKQCHYNENPVGFVDSLSDGVDRYIKYLKPNSIDNGNTYIKNIQHLAGESYKSYIVLLLAANNMNNDVFVSFKQILEAVIYYSMVDGIKGNETEKLFANWCAEIRKIKTFSDLRGFVTKSILPIITKWNKDKNYQQQFLSLGESSIQNYRVRFIVTRIARYIEVFKSGGTDWSDIEPYYAKEFTVEHIMPQKCDNKSQYGVTDEDFGYYLGLMGNLTILEKSINSSIQKDPYKKKIKEYPKSDVYLTQSLVELKEVGKKTAQNKINQKLKSWKDWNKTTIEERQNMLLSLADDVWNIESILAKLPST